MSFYCIFRRQQSTTGQTCRQRRNVLEKRTVSQVGVNLTINDAIKTRPSSQGIKGSKLVMPSHHNTDYLNVSSVSSLLNAEEIANSLFETDNEQGDEQVGYNYARCLNNLEVWRYYNQLNKEQLLICHMNAMKKTKTVILLISIKSIL